MWGRMLEIRVLPYQLYGGLSLIGKARVLKTRSNRDERRGRSSRPPFVLLGCPSGLRSFTANEVVIENGSRVRISSLAFIKGVNMKDIPNYEGLYAAT